ncbi:MAG: hypothetical protein AB7H80_16860 [Candidatus Kapaibacterium sp.]
MKSNNMNLKGILILMIAITTLTIVGCSEETKDPGKEENVEVWKGDDPTTDTQATTVNSGSGNNLASDDTHSGDSRIAFKSEEGMLYANITADLPKGTMVEVKVNGSNNYAYQTRYKVYEKTNRVGPITIEGKPLKPGTYNLTWEPLPNHTQIEEIRGELRRKNITGGSKSVTWPMKVQLIPNNSVGHSQITENAPLFFSDALT